MNNRVNEIRKVIRALRVSMMEAETIMREQVNRDQDCSFVAGELLKMRGVMAGLVREREALGDYAPIIVSHLVATRVAATRAPAKIHARPVKRQLAALGG